MADKPVLLSREVVAALKAMYDSWKSEEGNTTGRPRREEHIDQAPEVYVAKSPSGGIPALSGTTPGSATCTVYQTVGGATLLTSVTRTIYNYGRAVAADTYVIVSREKFGAWVVAGAGASTGLTTCRAVTNECLGIVEYWRFEAGSLKTINLVPCDDCDTGITGTGTGVQGCDCVLPTNICATLTAGTGWAYDSPFQVDMTSTDGESASGNVTIGNYTYYVSFYCENDSYYIIVTVNLGTFPSVTTVFNGINYANVANCDPLRVTSGIVSGGAGVNVLLQEGRCEPGTGTGTGIDVGTGTGTNSPGGSGSQTFTSNGTFTATTTGLHLFRGWGAGGSGNKASGGNGGGGGGGGGYFEKTLSLTVSQTVDVIFTTNSTYILVGAGTEGLAFNGDDASGSTGGMGGDGNVGDFLSNGGRGGDSGVGFAGGGGGEAGGSSGNGDDGDGGALAGGPGGNGFGDGGDGGNGGPLSGPGIAGSTPGGGSGGCGANDTGGVNIAGARGEVRVTW